MPDEVITIQRVLKHKGVTCNPEEVNIDRLRCHMCPHYLYIDTICLETCVQGTLSTRDDASRR